MTRWFALWNALREASELADELGSVRSACELDVVGLAWAVGFAMDFHRACPSA